MVVLEFIEGRTDLEVELTEGEQRPVPPGLPRPYEQRDVRVVFLLQHLDLVT